MGSPDLIAGESGGISWNWGNYSGVNAFSLSAATVIATDTLGEANGGRIAINGSLSISTSSEDQRFRLRSGSRTAIRVGAQFTW